MDARKFFEGNIQFFANGVGSSDVLDVMVNTQKLLLPEEKILRCQRLRRDSALIRRRLGFIARFLQPAANAFGPIYPTAALTDSLAVGYIYFTPLGFS